MKLSGWSSARFATRSVEHPNGTSKECFVPDALGGIGVGLGINRFDMLWAVSHLRSGMFINPLFPDAKTAADFLLALAPLTAWAGRTARELRADQSLRGAVVLLREDPRFANGHTVICPPDDDALDA